MLDLIEAACPVCGSDEFDQQQGGRAEAPAPVGPWTMVRCTACISRYLRPRPQEPARLYDGVEYHVHQRHGVAGAITGLMARLEAHRLGTYLEPGSRVFEIGCGTGETLGALKRLGYHVEGVELSAGAVAHARERGVVVEHGSFEDGFGASGCFDLVFSAHVLEHVTDPLGMLGEVRRLLRPGGVAVLKVPLAGGWDFDIFGLHSGSVDLPYHLCVPSWGGLETLVDSAGLCLVVIDGDPVPNDWVHGLRRWISHEFGVTLGFVQPWNPLFALPLLPFSILSTIWRRESRARVTIRK